LLFLDKHTTGDGIVSALQVLSALKRSGKSLPECMAGMHLFPQSLVNVTVAKGYDWQGNAALMSAKAAAEAELGDNGRVLIRASGTEPLIRVMVEAADAQQADAMAHRIADTMRA
jgi:phosphoglucosamine mutase